MLGLVLLVFVACPPSDEPPPKRAEPELGREQTATPLPAGRIVSLSVSATRFLLELGAGNQLLAVDRASSALPGLAALPAIEFDEVGTLGPEWVLVPALPDPDDPLVRRLEADGVRLLEFAPHDLEDVFTLCRGVGAELMGLASAVRLERRISRPLALVAGNSPALGRPRIVAVTGFDPLELAGGHSFETDLIEIAGGTSVTHGGEESRIAMGEGGWAELAPDLVLVMMPKPATPEEKAASRTAIPAEVRVEYFDFDAEGFWLDEPASDAERLRVLLASFAREGLGRPLR